MTRTESNVTKTEIRKIAAALAANLPPPPDIRPAERRETLCAFAADTGELAFPNFPCRGNRVECRRTGLATYAAACRPDNCKNYKETT